jgi:nicotinamidase-related amidase
METRRAAARGAAADAAQCPQPLTATPMPSDTCLLVIDAQQSFRHRPYFSEDGMAAYLSAQNALIRGAQRAGWAIVRVLHHDPQAPADDPFALESGLVRPLDGLADFDASHTVFKTRHSALVGTGLDVWLVQHGLGRLVVSGIRTEQCCETTARHASDLGWQVLFAAPATLTWGLRPRAGAPLDAAALHARTAAVLDGRFARVVDVDQALQTALADEAA